MSVLAAGPGRLYGSKDESNGRVNPALEPDYDMDPGYPNRVDHAGTVVGSGGGGMGSVMKSAPHSTGGQNNTVF